MIGPTPLAVRMDMTSDVGRRIRRIQDQVRSLTGSDQGLAGIEPRAVRTQVRSLAW